MTDCEGCGSTNQLITTKDGRILCFSCYSKDIPMKDDSEMWKLINEAAEKLMAMSEEERKKYGIFKDPLYEIRLRKEERIAKEKEKIEARQRKSEN